MADGMAVMTKSDLLAMEGLAESIADVRSARAALARPLMLTIYPEKGDPFEKEVSAPGERYYWTYGKGGPMRRARPEIADISDADRRMGAWLTKFGGTPADRSRVSAGPPETRNEFEDFG
jgi:hypothetical protein